MEEDEGATENEINGVGQCSLGWVEAATGTRVEGYVRGGKVLTLLAEQPDPYSSPRSFIVRSYHGRITRMLRSLFGPVGEVRGQIRAAHAGGTRTVGIDNWRATAPPGFNQSSYYFHDDHACWSPWISVSNVIFHAEVINDTIETGGRIGLPMPDPTLSRMSSELVGLNTGRKVGRQTLKISASTDPSFDMKF